MDYIHYQSSAASSVISDFVNAGTPVVVSGIGADWRTRHWSDPKLLAEHVGGEPVPLSHMSRAQLLVAPVGAARLAVLPALTPTLTPFCECIERIFNAGADYYYVREVDLLRYAPHLEGDFSFPFSELAGVCDPVLCWIGSRGCVSRLHFDLAHNFACVVTGRKRFRLFSPQQSHRLYPEPAAKFSPLSTIGDTALDDYPMFRQACFSEVEVGPGEMLFLPSFWWHQVITDEAGVMLTWFWNTPEMARDRTKLQRSTLGGEAGFARALALLNGFETQQYRDAFAASLVRQLLAVGQRARAYELLTHVQDPGFAREMAELFS